MTDFDRLLTWDDEVRWRWLLESQPDGEQRTNWWLSIIQPLSTQATGFGDRGGRERLAWAVLSAQVLELAREVGALAEREVANRLASLASVISGYPELVDVPPELTPDGAARRNLGNIRLSREEAVRMAENWPDRPIEDIRALREVRTPVRRIEDLADRIRDDHLRHEVAEWPAIEGQLP